MFLPSVSHRQRRPRFRSETGNITANPWDHVVYDISGGSATLTLPTTPPINTQVWVTLGTPTGANTVTISGTVHGNHDSKLYVDEDCLGLQWNGAAWKTIYDGLAAHTAAMYLANAITTSTAATPKKITFDTQSYDNASIADPTTNNRFDVRRAGNYLMVLQCRPHNTVADQAYYGARIVLDGTTTITDTRFNNSGTDTVITTITSRTYALTAGQFIEGFFLAEQTDDGCTTGLDNTFMSVMEIR